MNTHDDIDIAVDLEEERQIVLWGEQNHPDGTGPVYTEAADLAKASCEAAFANGEGTWLDILIEEVFEAAEEDDEDKLIEELVQVAAVAKNWVRSIRRRQAAEASTAVLTDAA